MISLTPTPLIAILRGVRPDEADAIASVIVEAGFGAVEVPLNSPEPFVSIETIARTWGDRISSAQGRCSRSTRSIAPPAPARSSSSRPMPTGRSSRGRSTSASPSLPGVATPTEAFRALWLGASALKLFPAEAMPPEVVKAWRSVLPKAKQLFPVGGVTPERDRALPQSRRRRLRHRLGALPAGRDAHGGCARGEGVCRGVAGGRVRSCRRRLRAGASRHEVGPGQNGSGIENSLLARERPQARRRRMLRNGRARRNSSSRSIVLRRAATPQPLDLTQKRTPAFTVILPQAALHLFVDIEEIRLQKDLT